MKKLNAKTLKNIFLSFAILGFGFSLAGGVGNIVANANETETTKPTATDYLKETEMMKGAAIRLGDKAGIRFGFVMDETAYADFTAEYEAKFGVLIAPNDYKTEYGVFSEATVFGNGATENNPKVYDWAVEQADGSFAYEDKGYTRIINLMYGEMTEYADDEIYQDKMTCYGSILDVLPENLAREFMSIGYIEYTPKAGGETEYYFLEENDNSRSMAYVAQLRIADPESDSEEEAGLYEKYIKPVETQASSYTVESYVVGEDTPFNTTVVEGVTINQAITVTPETFRWYEFDEANALNSPTSVTVLANGKLMLQYYYTKMPTPADTADYTYEVDKSPSTNLKNSVHMYLDVADSFAVGQKVKVTLSIAVDSKDEHTETQIRTAKPETGYNMSSKVILGQDDSAPNNDVNMLYDWTTITFETTVVDETYFWYWDNDKENSQTQITDKCIWLLCMRSATEDDVVYLKDVQIENANSDADYTYATMKMNDRMNYSKHMYLAVDDSLKVGQRVNVTLTVKVEKGKGDTKAAGFRTFNPAKYPSASSMDVYGKVEQEALPSTFFEWHTITFTTVVVDETMAPWYWSTAGDGTDAHITGKCVWFSYLNGREGDMIHLKNVQVLSLNDYFADADYSFEVNDTAKADVNNAGHIYLPVKDIAVGQKVSVTLKIGIKSTGTQLHTHVRSANYTSGKSMSSITVGPWTDDNKDDTHKNMYQWTEITFTTLVVDQTYYWAWSAKGDASTSNITEKCIWMYSMRNATADDVVYIKDVSVKAI